MAMATKGKLNVQRFPRPPRLEKTSRHLRITHQGQEVADTRDAYWVLETHHPPTYYLPPSSLTATLTRTGRSTWCEWKGAATYWQVALGDGKAVVTDRVWSYEEPTADFEPLRGHLSFYAGPPWECFVDGERVEAQPGDFYGGWVTSDLEGIVKGKRGNLDPVV
ncbi:hypothetical protein G6O67_005223 [Ophiocordyceps sinensis]|uniref:DUF427 domain-containing protein n=2 Tax=Ophiocordyceps sinensis TaxID=72228 RepID=A0A8H4V5Y7_9HYPO|nr:hypothetical protein OCS_03213 [Ophiocordyceps sinensis CO18]KAF4508895.1 hypothetical protein G6O67_005223 [Ophiocordyceps sinensis]